MGGRPFSVYMTVAQIEHGLRPFCPKCQARLVPESPDLWHLVPREELEASGLYLEYGAELVSFERGQNSAAKGSRQVIPGEPVRDRSGGKVRPARAGEWVTRRGIILKAAHIEAEKRVASRVASEARTRQLSGLRQYAGEPEAMPF